MEETENLNDLTEQFGDLVELDQISLIDFAELLVGELDEEIDLENYEYYRRYMKDTSNRDIMKLYANGIINGDGQGIFNPNGVIGNDTIIDILSRIEQSQHLDKPEYKSITDIPVVMYHEIGKIPKGGAPGLWVSEGNFKAQLDALNKEGYNTVTMEQVYQHRVNKVALPEKPIVLTFDDGYLSHYNFVMKELANRGMTGTFYLITSSIGEGKTVTPDMVREMYKLGMEVGSHTVNHLDARSMKESQQVKEYTESKEILEKILGVDIDHFCYPFGGHTETSKRALEKAGYKTATLTVHGKAKSTQDNLKLTRIRADYTDSISGYLRKIK